MSSFSSIDTVVTLNCALIRSKLEFVSVSWNYLTLNDSSKIEKVQKKFANIYYNIFFFNIGPKKYDKILVRLNLSPLHSRWQHHDALLLITIFVSKITGLSILNIVGLLVPCKILRGHSTFTAPYCAKASPSALFVNAANFVGSKFHIFYQQDISQKYLILSNTILFIYCFIPINIHTPIIYFFAISLIFSPLL